MPDVLLALDLARPLDILVVIHDLVHFGEGLIHLEPLPDYILNAASVISLLEHLPLADALLTLLDQLALASLYLLDIHHQHLVELVLDFSLIALQLLNSPSYFLINSLRQRLSFFDNCLLNLGWVFRLIIFMLNK